MNARTRIFRSGALLAAVAFLVACPPNAVLNTVEQQVTLVKSGSQPVATPQMSPPAGTYPGNQNVTITDATPGATIQYTIDGSKPTSASPVYAGPIPVTGDGTHETIIAYANKAGMTDSVLATANYVINFNQVQTPTFSLVTGSHVKPGTMVTISCTTVGASINYTTDGSTPTSSHGTAYSTPVPVNANETIQAMAYKLTMNDSNVASASYTVWVYTNYLYVSNGGGSGTVGGFKINTDGSLTSVGTPPVSTGASGGSVVVNANLNNTVNSFLYTSGSNNVQAWTVGSGGQLTTLGSALTTAYVGGPTLGITPSGSYVYAAFEISGIGSFYSVGSDGKLTHKADFSIGGTDPVGVAVTPNGFFFYITCWGNNLIAEYSIAGNGTPTEFNDIVTSQHPVLPTVSPNGSFLFLANQYVNSGYISSYAIDAGGGLTGKGAPATGGVYVEGSAVSPNNMYVYVANNTSNTISGFSIASDGTLTALSTPTFATGSGPFALAFSPDGSYLYVSNYNDGTISGFSVASNGLLTSLGAATPAGGTLGAGIVTAKIGQ